MKIYLKTLHYREIFNSIIYIYGKYLTKYYENNMGGEPLTLAIEKEKKKKGVKNNNVPL